MRENLEGQIIRFKNTVSKKKNKIQEYMVFMKFECFGPDKWYKWAGFWFSIFEEGKALEKVGHLDLRIIKIYIYIYLCYFREKT